MLLDALVNLLLIGQVNNYTAQPSPGPGTTDS